MNSGAECCYIKRALKTILKDHILCMQKRGRDLLFENHVEVKRRKSGSREINWLLKRGEKKRTRQVEWYGIILFTPPPTTLENTQNYFLCFNASNWNALAEGVQQVENKNIYILLESREQWQLLMMFSSSFKRMDLN